MRIITTLADLVTAIEQEMNKQKINSRKVKDRLMQMIIKDLFEHSAIKLVHKIKLNKKEEVKG